MFYPKPEKVAKPPKKRRVHAKSDPVDKYTRDLVLHRDRRCFVAKVDPGHTCRDQWGRAHNSDELDRMSLEHVKAQLRFGVRAESDPAHLVTLCHFENLRPPSKELREQMRSYLRALYPDQWPSLDTGQDGDTL